MEPEHGKLKLELDCKFSAHVQFELSWFDLAIPVAIKDMNIILILGFHHFCGVGVKSSTMRRKPLACRLLPFLLWPICEDLEGKVMQA